MKWWNKALSCQKNLSEWLGYDLAWQIDILDENIVLVTIRIIEGGENFCSFNNKTINKVASFYLKLHNTLYAMAQNLRNMKGIILHVYLWVKEGGGCIILYGTCIKLQYEVKYDEYASIKVNIFIYLLYLMQTV